MSWGLFFVVCFVLLLARKLHLNFVSNRYRYRLYALRDELRFKAITGEIDRDSREFDRLDRSISQSIEEHYFITLYSTTALVILHFRDFKGHSSNHQVEQSSSELESILKDLNSVHTEYIFSQHKYSLGIIASVVLGLIDGRAKMKSTLRKHTDAVSEFPETGASIRSGDQVFST